MPSRQGKNGSREPAMIIGDRHTADALAHRTAMLKACALVLLVASCILLLRFLPAEIYLRPEALEEFVQTTGALGPLLYVACSAPAVCMLVPGSALIGVAVALFGPYWGFLHFWTASLIAAGISFLISRTLGRDFAALMVGGKLAKYDDLIERNGFTAVLYLRLMCVPCALVNYGMGLTKVRFPDFLLGTALGGAVNVFVLAFFIGALREVWFTGDWARLLSSKVAFSLGLVVLSAMTPKVVDKVRRGRNSGRAGSP